MLFALLEFGVGEMVVAHVDLEHGVAHVDVELFFGYAQVGSHPFHVAYDAVGVGRAFHKQLAGAQEQVDTASE